MNTRERFLAIMNFEEPDRHLVWEFGYWGGTVRRWYKEGLPQVHGLRADIDGGIGLFNEAAGVPLNRDTSLDIHDYFKMDPYLVRVPLATGAWPPYEAKVIEDHGDWYI
ncbi:MAG: hypothetical protein WBC50_02205, partial [Dehalococcoidales bacterium]